MISAVSLTSDLTSRAEQVPVFRLRNVEVAYTGGDPALRVESLAVPAGQWTAIVGPNGAGKSTLLRAMAGLCAYRGEIELSGRSLSAWPAQDRARAVVWLGALPDSALDMQADQLVHLGRWPHQAWWASNSAEDAGAVEHAMRETDSWSLRHRLMGSLSAGERQRVWLARALATQAPTLLLDEPLAHLDPPQQALFLSKLRLWKSQGRTVVTVLHELAVALRADRVVWLNAGRMAGQGDAAQPSTHRALEALFEQRLEIRAVDGHPVPVLRI